MNKQRIASVDTATASGTNNKNFDILKSVLGFVPNMALAMAQSPAVLHGYMGSSVALIKGRLGKRLGEKLALTLAVTNRCEYCASPHRRASVSSHAAVQSELDREIDLNSMNKLSSAQFELQVRKQHYRILERQRISFVSALIVAIAVPVVLNASSLPWNRHIIAKDNGIVVLAEESVKPVPKARINVDSNGVSLKGYDPVAYFTRHQAVKGNPAIQTSFGGAIYYFASVADKVAFNKNPSKYVPQYGGFCAYHLSKGTLKDIDPTAFLIYKGKLYICSGADTAKEFRSNINQNIRKADDYWVPLSRAQGQPYSRGPR